MPKPAIPTSNIPEANPSDVASIDAIVTAAYDVTIASIDATSDGLASGMLDVGIAG